MAVGAFGGGYNYNVSPFWGLSGVDVIFGSGATGLFGPPTVAGAANFQSLNPTPGYHFSVTQGSRNHDKYITVLLGTAPLRHLVSPCRAALHSGAFDSAQRKPRCDMPVSGAVPRRAAVR